MLTLGPKLGLVVGELELRMLPGKELGVVLVLGAKLELVRELGDSLTIRTAKLALELGEILTLGRMLGAVLGIELKLGIELGVELGARLALGLKVGCKLATA
jgi:hypothetical protein